MNKHVVVPIEATDKMLTDMSGLTDFTFGGIINSADDYKKEMSIAYQAAIAAAPDTGMIAVDKDALENAISRYLIASYRCHSIRNNVHGNGICINDTTFFPKEMAESIIQALKDLEGNHDN